MLTEEEMDKVINHIDQMGSGFLKAISDLADHIIQLRTRIAALEATVKELTDAAK
jgi:archaellum component FlaC